MAVPKALTESGWKAIIQKHKVKDNGLQKALAEYSKIAEEKYPERLKALGEVSQLAGNLKRSKACMSQAEVVKYLGEILKAVEAEEREIETASAKAAADAKKAAASAKQEEAPPKPDPQILQAVFEAGLEDGFDALPSKAGLFAKAPPYKAEYERGYRFGVQNRQKGPQTSMSPISEADRKKSIDYTKRKKARKEFIQYLNKWWKTRLPEDL